MEEGQQLRNTLNFLVSVCSAALIVASLSIVIAVYSTVVLHGVRTEQRMRTNRVYGTDEMRGDINVLEQSDTAQWKEIEKLRSTKAIRQR